jgi:hypothetical protein
MTEIGRDIGLLVSALAHFISSGPYIGSIGLAIYKGNDIIFTVRLRYHFGCEAKLRVTRLAVNTIVYH